jgi:two-component system sensor histidine kinase TorS
MVNLISNALKFTDKGIIKIICDFDPEKLLVFTTVSDSGIGIKKSDQVKLFKLFGKLKCSNKQNMQGIGLGLNVCKRIVKFFNGEMSVQSELGHGSKFEFSFSV